MWLQHLDYDSLPSYCFSPDSKEILFRLLYFYNDINEVQTFCYVIFEKLKFFLSGIFISIGCFFSYVSNNYKICFEKFSTCRYFFFIL